MLSFFPRDVLDEILDIQSNFNGSNTFGTMNFCSRQGEFEPLRVYYRARSGGINRDIFLIFFNMKVYCVYSLESPQRVHTIYTIYQYKKKFILNYPESATMGFVPRDPRTSLNQPW